MKDPQETIRNLRDFAVRISSEYYKPNFMRYEDYLMFLQDLNVIARELHQSCETILENSRK